MIQLENYYRHRVSQAAYDLFAVFARFEYAMKVGGFRRDKNADAAWKKFANNLPQDIFSRIHASPEAAIYFTSPPDRLVVNDGNGVRWSGQLRVPTNMLELLESIKTARNNLFHGDKRHDNRRDNDLMIAALFILNEIYKAVEQDPKFQHFIDEMEYGL